MDATLGIIWGARETTSLVGIVITVVSHWYFGRKWDEEGTLAYDAAVEAGVGVDYAAVDEEGRPTKKYVTNADGSRDAISVCTGDNRDDAVSVPAKALENAMPVPYPGIAGHLIWALSFLFVPGRPLAVYAGWNMAFLLILPIMAVLFAFHIRKTTIERNLDYKKKAMSMILVFSIILVIAGIVDDKTYAPWYFCFFGALLLFFSYHTMRRSRKMGITWDMYAKPSSEIAAHNLGALTLILAFYLIWVGTNGVIVDQDDQLYLPIYVNYRAWFVFISAFVIIIPSTIAMDYLFDQGAEPVALGYGDFYRLDNSTPRDNGEEGASFASSPLGDYLATPWPLLFGWTLFGCSSFMPFGYGVSIQQVTTCFICVLIGAVYSFRLLPAYWNREADFKRWNYVYYVGMIFLLTLIGLQGEALLITPMIGTIFILIGQHMQMFEKKKGNHWIKHGEDNPRPEVAYSIGHPIYIFGWLLLCVGMSFPME